MTELLSSGPERPQRAVGKAVVACLVVVAIVALLVQRSGRRTGPTAAPATTTRTPAVLRTDLLPTAPAASPELVVEPSLDGITSALPRGTVLLVGGPHPLAIGGRLGQFDRLPLRNGDDVTGILPVRDGYVVLVSHVAYTPGQPSANVYRVRADGRTNLVIAADHVIVAAGGDRVFALRYGSTQANIQASQLYATLSEVTLAGKVVARHAVTPDFDALADTPRGLLSAVYPPQGGEATTLQVLDPHTLAVRDRLGPAQDVFVDGPRVAWTRPGCRQPCALTLEDLTSGTRRQVTTTAGWAVGSVAVSPDGRRVALSYLGRHVDRSTQADAGFVEVVDPANGQRQRVPGVASAEKANADLAWTPSGALAISVGYPGSGLRQIGLWTGGPVRVLPLRLTDGGLPTTLVAR